MKKQAGSQTLEFAMIALPFLILILAIFELTRFLWVNMVFDSAVNHALRVARVMEPSYIADQAFKAKIGEYPLIDSAKLEVTQPIYAKTISDLANTHYTSSSQAQLGQYTVTYSFAFLLVPKLSEYFVELVSLERTVVVAYDS